MLLGQTTSVIVLLLGVLLLGVVEEGWAWLRTASLGVLLDMLLGH